MGRGRRGYHPGHYATRAEHYSAARRRGRHTKEEWLVLQARFGWSCVACLKVPAMRGSLLARDHVIPISKSGSDSIDNIQPLCFRCNSVKGVSVVDYRPSFFERFGMPENEWRERLRQMGINYD